MGKVKHCSLDWTGLDVQAWTENQAEFFNQNISFKDWDSLSKPKKDILLRICTEAIEYSEESIIEHINSCIAEYVQDNYNGIIKELIKYNIATK